MHKQAVTLQAAGAWIFMGQPAALSGGATASSLCSRL